MAMASNGHGGGGEEEAKQLAAQLSKTLKEGERIVAPTRRADGTLRKPIRIRAGYVPQDEVAIYQSKGALWRKEMQSLQEVPPGYDLDSDVKPKTKAAKKNERKKEKRQQAALDKGKNLENNEPSAEDSCQETEAVKSVVSQMNDLAVSVNSAVVTPPSSSTQCSTPDPIPDIDKKIRALKKKVLGKEDSKSAGGGEIKDLKMKKHSRGLLLLERQEGRGLVKLAIIEKVSWRHKAKALWLRGGIQGLPFLSLILMSEAFSQSKHAEYGDHFKGLVLSVTGQDFDYLCHVQHLGKTPSCRPKLAFPTLAYLTTACDCLPPPSHHPWPIGAPARPVEGHRAKRKPFEVKSTLIGVESSLVRSVSKQISHSHSPRRRLTVGSAFPTRSGRVSDEIGARFQRASEKEAPIRGSQGDSPPLCKIPATKACRPL
ncbi:partner of Y14-MAGO [Actinidia rufa]|uniref:Partner of Y14-MAGO n=1 Tax=Actinidia rufa TaxID=165716 RepID=A0A7J0ESM6_9ERIC|nr:partner of Y14-MAGO [Actinidia rufa]